MGISKRDMLMGLMHSAEQGKKLREGTDLANKKLNEGDQKRGPIMINPFGGNDPRPGWGSIYGQLANTTIVPTKETNPTLVSPPGKPEVANSDARTGFGSDRPVRLSRGEVSPKEAASANPNADLRSKLEAGDAAAAEEQRRRDRSEAQMNAARNESYNSRRGRIILETLNSLLFQR